MSLKEIVKKFDDCNKSCNIPTESKNYPRGTCLSTKNMNVLCNPPQKNVYTSQSQDQRICAYICQDKYRENLSDYTMKYGKPTLPPGQGISQYPYSTKNSTINRMTFPFNETPRYNTKYYPTKYITVKDMDNSFTEYSETTPFTNSTDLITGGYWGEYNRAKPYQHLYNFLFKQNNCEGGGNYGQILKATKPQRKDVN